MSNLNILFVCCVVNFCCLVAVFAMLLLSKPKHTSALPTNQPVLNSLVNNRSMFYDTINYVIRPYLSVKEVYSYLNIPIYRKGPFYVYINAGGSIDKNGNIIGGITSQYVMDDSLYILTPLKPTLYE